jgi:hypothetical protein
MVSEFNITALSELPYQVVEQCVKQHFEPSLFLSLGCSHRHPNNKNRDGS